MKQSNRCAPGLFSVLSVGYLSASTSIIFRSEGCSQNIASFFKEELLLSIYFVALLLAYVALDMFASKNTP
jgi:hypothetical protein